MKSTTLEQFKQDFGTRATDSTFERELYSRDLGPVPAMLVNPLFKTTPDLVIRPENSSEIAAVMKMAWEEKLPVTPRAGASTVYFDSVPAKSGILLDLNLLKGIVSLDEGEQVVNVRGATTWEELETYLNRRGLAARSMPSSAPAATVAGWLCMMGYGIGSLKYGSLASQIRSLEVVLPNGEIKRVTRTSFPPLHWFEASEGTLGIITEVELKVRENRPMSHYLIHLDDPANIADFLQTAVGAGITPYNMHFNDVTAVRAFHTLGLSEHGDDGCLIGIDYEGNPEQLDRANTIIKELVASRKDIKLMPEGTGDKEWDERFKALRLKRGGPSVLGAEVWLPVKELPAYLQDVERMSRRYKMTLISYGHMVTREAATVMTMFYADETKTIKYILELGLVKKIQDIGARYGGHPYGVGLWNTPYRNKIHSYSERGDLIARKQQLDPRGILNPGKVYRPPVMLNPLNFRLGMNLFAGLRRLSGGGKRI